MRGFSNRQLGGEVVTNSEKSIVFKSNVQSNEEIINTRCFGSSPAPLETMVLKERGLNKLCWPGGCSKSCFANAHMMFSLTSAAMTTRTRTLNM